MIQELQYQNNNESYNDNIWNRDAKNKVSFFFKIGK